MQRLNTISAILDNYDALLLDLWGVVHDGTHLYPGVHDALMRIRRAGKKIVMLSNAPRRSAKVAARLGELGIEPALYDGVVSSGEGGYQWLAAGNGWGERYYYIGPARDAGVLEGLPHRPVATLAEADYLLNVGFGTDEQSHDDFLPLLHEAKALALPMLCLNPDLEVVKISGECYPCAGVIAKQYLAIGGEVVSFGKPFPAVYELCVGIIGKIDKSRLLAIGDSLETDIPGAAHFGIDSVLVTGGILKKKTEAELEALFTQHGVRPTYIAPALTW